MNKKYLNSIALILMIIITFITQVLALLKSSLVASYFGASNSLDAFNFANSIISFVFGFLSAGIATIIIPAYIKKEEKKYVDSFITFLLLILIAMAILVAYFRFSIVHFISNRDDSFVKMAGNILIILLGANFLLIITNVTAAFYLCVGKYNIPKILNLLSQVCVIVALLCFKNLSIVQYSLIIALGIVLNFSVDICGAIKCGWRYKPAFYFKNPNTKRLLYLFLPMIFSTGIYQLSLMIDSSIASRLDTGMITILSYSGQIARMVNTIIIGNMLTFTYPKIIKRIQENKNSNEVFWNQVSFFHLIVCLIIAGFAVIGYSGVSLLFEHGKFTSMAINDVYIGTLLYLIGQQSSVISDLIYRFFYANGDTKVAASNSVLVSIVNIITSVILVYFIGFYGIIVGTIIASFASLIRIYIKYKKKFGNDVPTKNIVISFIINNLIMIAVICVVVITKYFIGTENRILDILVFGCETISLFLILSVLLKRKNLKSAIQTL